MRQAHVFRQGLIRFLVRQIVGDVSKESAPRLQFFHQAERVRHRGMRGMRAMAQRIQKEYIQPAQLLF